jgi:hypothetical protein
LNIFFVVNIKNLIFPYIRCDRTLYALNTDKDVINTTSGIKNELKAISGMLGN